MSRNLEGGCSCGKVRYRLKRKPMITHCCHCTWCQRETESAFVVSAVIEMSEVELTGTAPEMVLTPSASGRGQPIARCPECHVTVWSHYQKAGELAAFVRAGTLDDKTAVAPDVHIFTGSKVPWLTLTDGKPIFEDFYPDLRESSEASQRWNVLLASRAAQ